MAVAQDKKTNSKGKHSPIFIIYNHNLVNFSTTIGNAKLRKRLTNRKSIKRTTNRTEGKSKPYKYVH